MKKAMVLFAGGGTGGHIYPNIAIAEALAAERPDLEPHFFLSSRRGDALLVEKLGHAYTISPVQPLPDLRRPWRAVPFLWAWNAALASARRLLRARPIAAIVATGGFVSGPAILAGAKVGVPRALVNLDAVPGKANRRLARECDRVFTVAQTAHLTAAELIGFPLRAASISADTRDGAIRMLGLEPGRPLLFITGATHGAESIIRMMLGWLESTELNPALRGWQVLHQCGGYPVDALQRAYDAAGVPATVVARLDGMGAAFRAADLVVARAGAGTVAEAWANAAATVFLPNPFHRDAHQRHNAAPLVALGGAITLRDRIDAAANLAQTVPAIAALLRDPARRQAMRTASATNPPSDGARAVAAWVARAVPTSR